MVVHIVCWDLNDTVNKEDYPAVKSKIKELLEALTGQVPGLISARVIDRPLASGNTEVALVCELESAEALSAYQIHPAHLEAAGFVRSVTCNRRCLDYEV